MSGKSFHPLPRSPTFWGKIGPPKQKFATGLRISLIGPIIEIAILYGNNYKSMALRCHVSNVSMATVVSDEVIIEDNKYYYKTPVANIDF
jgi:hypothetical protein